MRHPTPSAHDPWPASVASPPGVTLVPWLGEADVDAAVDLVADGYWNDRYDRDELRRAHLGSTAWVGARDEGGTLIATARALSDGGKVAWIHDVGVAPAWRRRGVGRAVCALLLEHPRVRGARRVLLGTRDAQPLYAGLGFVDVATEPPRSYASTQMVLERSRPGAGAPATHVVQREHG